MENEWIQWGIRKIEDYISVGYKRANDILE